MTTFAAWAQIAAAIATALLAFFTWRLARAAKTEGGEIRKQAEATELLAAAARAESNEMRKQAEATERHVTVSDEARRGSTMPWLATGSSKTESVTLLIDGIQTDTPNGA